MNNPCMEISFNSILIKKGNDFLVSAKRSGWKEVNRKKWDMFQTPPSGKPDTEPKVGIHAGSSECGIHLTNLNFFQL